MVFFPIVSPFLTTFLNPRIQNVKKKYETTPLDVLYKIGVTREVVF